MFCFLSNNNTELLCHGLLPDRDLTIATPLTGWQSVTIFSIKIRPTTQLTNSIKILFFQLHPFRAEFSGIIVARFVQLYGCSVIFLYSPGSRRQMTRDVNYMLRVYHNRINSNLLCWRRVRARVPPDNNQHRENQN